MKFKRILQLIMTCQVVLISVLLFPYKSYPESPSVGLPLAMYALQVTAGLRTAPTEMTLNVPADYSTIQQAINASIDNTKIIVAGGTYNETLEIKNKILTIEGAGPAGDGKSVITGSSNNAETGDTVIYIENSSVTLKGALIKTGKFGLNLVVSKVAIENSIIDGNWIGIHTDNSFLSFDGGKFTNNSYIGGNITNTSQLYLLNSEVSGNPDRGVQIFNNSGAYFGSCTITNNKWGISVSNGSGIQVAKNQVSGNAEFGILAGLSSAINMCGGNTISNNDKSGILIDYSSSLVQHNDLGYGEDTISNNTQYGVVVIRGGTSHFENASITGNSLGGIVLNKNSSVFLQSPTSITSNSNAAILFDDTSSFEIPKAPATLIDFTGNTPTFCYDCSDFSKNDLDGDGYRQAEYVFDGVSAMVNKGDCNDGNPSIYPEATEVCGDGVDNDCDGEIDEGC